ncbi:hypothetical protein PV11_03808 [Exophiala sideris]|uniref:DUF676 domain-containing protein n=1 Tax=Exophiala sideris TaxID=1016849 RepID=A0A0D1Z440_9EURO|nr:hypothetical protein PV11_03808 [Exophiala sideris]
MLWRVRSLHARRLPQPRRHILFSIRHESSAKPSQNPSTSKRTTRATDDNQDRSKAGSDQEKPIDASFSDLGRVLRDDYANFRDHYSTPQYPIVLAHGLLGFDELRLLPGNILPGLHYWRGIKQAFEQNGIECITTTVPRTGTIEDRASALAAQIAARAKGKDINIVAHSMGGLDARYLISRLCPEPSDFRVRSLTTIATPHRGSAAADMLIRDIGPDLLPRIYKMLELLSIESGAFSQLTTTYVQNHFNKVVPNHPQVRYFSYGAAATPHLFSVFRLSHDLMQIVEGPNDGLVSVKSSRWGDYMGTLMGATHLDLINWTNRIKHAAATLGLIKENFNARAFYLGVADMLAKEGL